MIEDWPLSIVEGAAVGVFTTSAGLTVTVSLGEHWDAGVAAESVTL